MSNGALGTRQRLFSNLLTAGILTGTLAALLFPSQYLWRFWQRD
jgi:hypothetical protein